LLFPEVIKPGDFAAIGWSLFDLACLELRNVEVGARFVLHPHAPMVAKRLSTGRRRLDPGGLAIWKVETLVFQC
jgi:hypothetical protein